jgi:hypothetical protein
MSRQLLKSAGHEAFPRLLHTGFKSLDLELACFDKVGDMEPTRRSVSNRYIHLPTFGSAARTGLRRSLALLSSGNPACRHVDEGHEDSPTEKQ